MTHKWAWLDDEQTHKLCWRCLLTGRRHGMRQFGHYWEWRRNSQSIFGGRTPRCTP